MDKAADSTPSTWGTRAAELALEVLRYGWGDAYDIGRDDSCGYWARRRDGLGGVLTAGDPDALRGVIRADYEGNRVPRVLPAGDGR